MKMFPSLSARASWLTLPSLFLAFLSLGEPLLASPATENVDWPIYLGNKARNLYSPLAQINRTNVTQLKVAWTYDTGDRGEYQANNRQPMPSLDKACRGHDAARLP